MMRKITQHMKHIMLAKKLQDDISIYIMTDNVSNISIAVKDSDHNHVHYFGYTIIIAVHKGLLNMQTQLLKLLKSSL